MSPSLYMNHASVLTSILARLARPFHKLSTFFSSGALHQKLYLLNESLPSAIHRGTAILTNLGSLLRQASTNSLKGLLW